MPDYKAPGVYIEEVDTGAMPIEGVGTSTAGFIGPTERGPVDPKTAGFITSPEEFERKFGGASDWTTGEGDAETEISSNVPSAVEGFFANGGTGCYVARVVAKGPIPQGEDATEPATASQTFENEGGEGTEKVTAATVEAIGPGEWGDNVVVVVDDASSGSEDRFSITVRYWRTLPDAKYRDDDRPPVRPEVNEVYDELSAEESDDRFYESIINAASDLVQVTKEEDGRLDTETPDSAPEGVEALVKDLTGGSDGTGPDDYDGETTTTDGETTRTGLEAFTAIDEISLLNAPNETEVDSPGTLRDALLTHCTEQGDRFAILQAKKDYKQEDGVPTEASSTRGYSAFYYPWLEVIDPQTGTPTLVPPGGHVAGVIARTDGARGVHKAPANEALRGINGLQRDVTQAEQTQLNPKGVNCIRTFRGRGTLVYGARTTASNPLWKYVNVRRLFLYIEESIQEGTQWAVFEPNDEELWARVRQSVSNFLTDVWNDGALMGETPEEAFYVKADRSTMTQNDIDNGKLVVEVGVAPTKPAEFVVFEITQWTGGAEAA